MPRRAVLFALALTPVGLLIAAGPSPSPSPSPVEPNTAGTVDTIIKIENFTFGPPLVRVKRGTVVTWINQDDTPHTVVAVGGGFKSKALDTDDQFSFRFSSVGAFDYFCSLHPHMVGKIVVEG